MGEVTVPPGGIPGSAGNEIQNPEDHLSLNTLVTDSGLSTVRERVKSTDEKYLERVPTSRGASSSTWRRVRIRARRMSLRFALCGGD